MLMKASSGATRIIYVYMFDRLIERRLLAPSDMARAEEIVSRVGGRVPATLVRLGMVDETDLAAELAAAQNLSFIQRSEFPDEIPLIDGLNNSFLARHNAVPIRLTDGKLTVVLADPSDAETLNALRFASGADTALASVGTFSDIADAIRHYFPNDEVADMVGAAAGDNADDLERLAESDSEAPIIRLVQRVLAGAAARGASDVHIEPMARHIVVRYRIDGRLEEIERHSDSLAAPIASRIKVMANLDIAESRLPQDGRLRLTFKGKDIDVRVSTSPIAHGESIVLRLLGQRSVPLDLEKLGLPETVLAKLGRALASPHGIVLLTGPTGSGKTTTLYSAINRLRAPDVKILTVEDPVEVMLDGVNQVQVRPDIDLTYANALRAFLRQDPDILMIGEIRDRETADIAMRAALTGHLVLSTLHTNSAAGAFARLADIGVERFLTASTTVATIAQRLVRALCQECTRYRAPTEGEAQIFSDAGVELPASVADARGCSVCGHAGYRGRLPIMEILEIDEACRESIRIGSTQSLMATIPTSETLFGHGLSLVALGRTSLAEIQRVVQS